MTSRRIKFANGKICRNTPVIEKIKNYIIEHSDYNSSPECFIEFVKSTNYLYLNDTKHGPISITDPNNLVTWNETCNILKKLYKHNPELPKAREVLTNVKCKPVDIDAARNLRRYTITADIVDRDLYNNINGLVYYIIFKAPCLGNVWYTYKVGMTTRTMAIRLNEYAKDSVESDTVFATHTQFVAFLNSYYNTDGFECKIFAMPMSNNVFEDDPDESEYKLHLNYSYNPLHIETAVIKHIQNETGKCPIGCIIEKRKNL
jgi:hypothetical protein